MTKLVRDDNGDIIESASFISDTETATTSQELDAFGRAISVTDALENTTYTEYDADGKPTHTWGSTYPSKFTYDTEGRLTTLSTTQDGTTWKTTTWAYDPETGYPTTKTYADGTTIAYTHTSDGNPSAPHGPEVCGRKMITTHVYLYSMIVFHFRRAWPPSNKTEMGVHQYKWGNGYFKLI